MIIIDTLKTLAESESFLMYDCLLLFITNESVVGAKLNSV